MATADSLERLTALVQALTQIEDAGWYREAVGRGMRVNTIPFDMAETADAILVQAYLPGFRREDVHVELRDGQVIIHADRPLPQANQVKWLHVESPYGTFLRTIQLSASIAADQIEAGWHEGVLILRLPKVEAARTRTIPIQASADLLNKGATQTGVPLAIDERRGDKSASAFES